LKDGHYYVLKPVLIVIVSSSKELKASTNHSSTYHQNLGFILKGIERIMRDFVFRFIIDRFHPQRN